MNQINATHIATPATLTPTWRVTYRGEEAICPADEVPATCADMIARLGAPTAADYPRPEPVTERAPAVLALAPAPAPAPVVRGETVNEEGRARSALADAAAREGGFTPKQPLYSRGTMVVELGVDNARAARAEFEAMPTVEQCVGGFLADFEREGRLDIETDHALRMDKGGRLVLQGGARLTVNERAFTPLCSRLGFGGGDYLAGCWPELRAINVNRWMDSYQKAHEAEVVTALAERKDVPEAKGIVLRTREVPESGREVYAAVSGGYAAFDADRVAQALRLAMPEDARLRVEYDGFRSRFDVLFHSTVAPADFVAGEFFRAGITIRTDDTGGGSLRGQTFVEQNLCLNLIIIDKAVQPLFTLRHIGSVEKLAEKFREGLGAAQDTLAHFLAVWGFARKDDLVEQARERGEFGDMAPADAGLISVSDYFTGFANGLIERELVPLRARGGATARDLRRMFVDDTSSDGPSSGRVTRAGLVNAVTRYAHRVEVDPFRAAETERAASALLWPTRGRLPEIPFTAVTL